MTPATQAPDLNASHLVATAPQPPADLATGEWNGSSNELDKEPGSSKSLGAVELTQETRLPDNWSWPWWTFQKSPPCIEVYVHDEESGQSKWVLATPEDRVVDKDGHDAFISAEYEWNSADFVQDFGPDQVRRLGEVLTIADLLEVL